MKKFSYLALCLGAMALVFSSCKKKDPDPEPEPEPITVTDGLFVMNAGNYGSPNASLSFYDTENEKVSNDIFYEANKMKLGDGAQSMYINGETGWICVTNSNVVFAIDTDTYLEKGRVEGVIAPRYFLQVDEEKAYVTQMWTNTIAVVNTKTYEVVDYIEIPGMSEAEGSTEEMIMVDDFVYCNLWSYQKEIVKINKWTDEVVDRMEVGIQPKSMAYDKNHGVLWVLVDGGAWDQNPIGYEAPSLVAIDLGKFKLLRTVKLTLGENVASLNYYDGYLYWLSGGVKRMMVSGEEEPQDYLIPASSGNYYAMTMDPNCGDIYVADVLDYMQNGKIDYFTMSGKKKGSFDVGVIPTGFCWKQTEIFE
ncbi:MAG: YncE family protein [Muribaculaceae bacterium]|nr:YncE family protein [Muribaculaceae bacterium]